MEIVNEALRADVEKLLEEPEVPEERLLGLLVIEVPQVVADERPVSPPEGEGRLQMTSHGQGWSGEGIGESEGLRRVAPGPPDRRFRPLDHPGDRVVATDADRTIVDEESVGDARQLVDRPIVERDRLVRSVPARHDEGTAPHLGHEELVKRGIGQHEPETGTPGRDERGKVSRPRGLPSPEKDDRGPETLEERPFERIDPAEFKRGLDVPDHDGQGLLLPSLPGPEEGHRIIPAGIADEVKSPEALEGSDLPFL
jgi:hypothetical protein